MKVRQLDLGEKLIRLRLPPVESNVFFCLDVGVHLWAGILCPNPGVRIELKWAEGSLTQKSLSTCLLAHWQMHSFE